MAQKKNNKEMSFERYRRENYEDYNRNYTDAIEARLAELAREKSAFGKQRDGALDRGYSKSGYAERLKAKIGEGFAADKRKLMQARDTRERHAKQDYQSYLENYDRRQTSIYNRVVESLARYGVTSPDKAYEYALSAGLREDRAMAAIESARGRMFEVAKHKVLELCEINEITPEAAETYARAMGLSAEEVRQIGDLAREYMRNDQLATDSYLEYIESISKYK